MESNGSRIGTEICDEVETLCVEQCSSDRSLEEYLRALLAVTRRFADRDSVSPDDFLELLTSAFSTPPADYEADWSGEFQASDTPPCDFAGWRSTLIRQVVDLHEMEAAGSLADEHRSFGIDSPRGSRWFNFTPVAYLECAAAGSFGQRSEESFSRVSWEDFEDFSYCGQIYE